MNTVIVTGGFGMLGSNVVASLAQTAELNIIVIDNDIREMKVTTLNFWSNLKLKIKPIIINKDVRCLDASELKELTSGDIYFIHLADIVAGIDYVFNNQYEILKENQSIDLAAFELAKELDVKKIIYASTACVFNRMSQTSIKSKVSISKDLYPAFPESTYGWAKLFGEIALFQLFEKSAVASVIYFHNIIGIPCDYWSEKSQVTPAIAQRILLARTKGLSEIVVWGSGKQGRALLPVKIAANYLKQKLFDQDYKDRYQFGPDVCTSINAIAKHFISLNKEPMKIINDLSKPEGDKGRSIAKQDVDPNWIFSDNVVKKTLTEVYQWIESKFETAHKIKS